ncbi:MAG: proton-conducting membrane transporter [Ruminococcaceae bacterium]|nr:proton-conducting membrane transporter [Oscillospiraceae bacterium]
MIMIAAIVLPMILGAALPFVKIKNRNALHGLVIGTTALEAVLGLAVILSEEKLLELWRITDTLTVSLRADGMAKLFTVLFTFGWLLVSVFAFEYMKHEHNEDRFYAFFLLSEGALVGLSLSANMAAMYLCFELATLLSMPLVLHSMKKDAMSAALKYLFYSIAGAFMALLGIFFLAHYSTSLDFVPGGCLDRAAAEGHEGVLLTVILITVIGFGTKAGMYPMHGWLPTAHPVAPAPASAVLSALIAKAGVLAIVRILYYVVGVDFVKGTWVQITLLSLSLFTVLMGSLMAYRERNLKKRLAFSTVSQISYILTSLFIFSAEGVQGALLHTVFHAAVKTCLFLGAGALIYCTGKTAADEYKGMGRKMPVVMWSFALASVTLIGIPPTGGFWSKWAMASAALDSAPGFFSWLIPVVLLISALLTAGYLMPVVIDAFFPGEQAPAVKRSESPMMWAPMAVLAAVCVLLGMFSGGLAGFTQGLASLLV